MPGCYPRRVENRLGRKPLKPDTKPIKNSETERTKDGQKGRSRIEGLRRAQRNKEYSSSSAVVGETKKKISETARTGGRRNHSTQLKQCNTHPWSVFIGGLKPAPKWVFFWVFQGIPPHHTETAARKERSNSLFSTKRPQVGIGVTRTAVRQHSGGTRIPTDIRSRDSSRFVLAFIWQPQKKEEKGPP